MERKKGKENFQEKHLILQISLICFLKRIKTLYMNSIIKKYE